MLNILVYEEVKSAPRIIETIRAMLRNVSGENSIVLAVSDVEADTRLPHVDMAIINVDGKGRDLAYLAVNKIGIPVIALTSADGFAIPSNTEKLCFIQRSVQTKKFSAKLQLAVLSMMSAIYAKRMGPFAFESHGFSRN